MEPETIRVMPAYSRDYKTKKEALLAWHSGKDFKVVHTGAYVSRADLPATIEVHIMYKKLSKVAIVKT